MTAVMSEKIEKFEQSEELSQYIVYMSYELNSTRSQMRQALAIQQYWITIIL